MKLTRLLEVKGESRREVMADSFGELRDDPNECRILILKPHIV